jgi:hypothetical protein
VIDAEKLESLLRHFLHRTYGGQQSVLVCRAAPQRLGQPRHRKTTNFLGKTG